METVVLVRSPVPMAAAAPKGSWYWTPVYGQADKPRTLENASIIVSCAICGAIGVLRDAERLGKRKDGTHGHDIAADGTVSPSVVCPKHCGWHVMAKLDAWDGGDTQLAKETQSAVDGDESAMDEEEVIAEIEAKQDLPPTADPRLRQSTWKCPVCQWEQPLEEIPKRHDHLFHGGNCPCCHKGVMVQIPALAPAKPKE